MDIPFILQLAREIGLSGGSECVAFELHRAWLAMGVDARVLTTHATEPEADHGILLMAAWLHSWSMRSRGRHLAALITVPFFTLVATWKAWRTRGSKLIFSHGDSLIGDVCVVHAVNRACLAEKRRMGLYGWMFNPLNLWIEWRDRYMLRGRRYRRLIAISERTKNELMQYYNVPDVDIVTIPNGINLKRFTPNNAAARNEVRKSFGISAEAPVVLFVGSRFRIKGLKFAIEALARMDTQAVLLVVGDDNAAPFRELAHSLGVSDRVIFAGAQKNLPEIYPAADALLLPTLYETFALVCLEAMASGTPVVAAPAGGIEDYLHDGVNGIHINHDPIQIAAQLDRLLNDHELSERIRSAGLQTASKYGWDEIANQYLNLFDELLAERVGKFQTLNSNKKISTHGLRANAA